MILFEVKLSPQGAVTLSSQALDTFKEEFSPLGIEVVNEGGSIAVRSDERDITEQASDIFVAQVVTNGDFHISAPKLVETQP